MSSLRVFKLLKKLRGLPLGHRPQIRNAILRCARKKFKIREIAKIYFRDFATISRVVNLTIHLIGQIKRGV